MKTRSEILKLWADYDACEDFGPVLVELLDDRERLELKLDPTGRKIKMGDMIVSYPQMVEMLELEIASRREHAMYLMRRLESLKQIKFTAHAYVPNPTALVSFQAFDIIHKAVFE